MSDSRVKSGRMVEVAVAVILREGRVWLQKRRDSGHLDGLWEFPGGKIEPGESPLQALLREVREEVDLELKSRNCRLFKVVEHPYPQRRVKLYFFLCPLDGRPRVKASALQDPLGGAENKPQEPAGEMERAWFGVGELASLPLPEANHSVVEDLVRYCAQ